MFIFKKEVLKANKGDVISVKYDKKVSIGAPVLLTTDNNQIKKINDALKNNTRKVLIDAFVQAKKGSPLSIKVSDGKNTVLLKSDKVLQRAISAPTSKETIIKQLRKTGDTAYKVRNIVIDNDDVFISIKDINELRRNALDKLNEKRLYKIPFLEKEYKIDVPDFKPQKKTSILVNNKEDYIKNKDNYDCVYVTDKNLVSDKCILKIPRVVNKYEKHNVKVLIGEVGSLVNYKNFDTDFSFNVVNSYTVAYLHALGAKKVTLSHELTLVQTKKIIDAYHERYKKHPNLEVINEGYEETMICKFDLNKMHNVKTSYLMDEYKNKFKIVSSPHFMTIYNYKKITYVDIEKYYEIGINSLRTNLI